MPKNINSIKGWCRGTKGVMKAWNKGKPNVVIAKEKHWNWKGGKTNQYSLIKKSIEWKQWRQKVFERDNYECQSCETNQKLCPHHLYSFSKYPEYRFETWNGQTLCVSCHEHLHNELGRK
jgi:5-methylcytosine-specific restriction endonuclease McrA